MRESHQILVVEDDKHVRDSLYEILDLNGYQVVVAENGEKGLQIAQQELPDLIITDLMMPVMDGVEFSKKILSNPDCAHIPIIMLTALGTPDDRVNGLEAGAVDYITKPYHAKELTLKIRNLLETREKFKQRNWQYLLSASFEDPDLTEDERFLKEVYNSIIENIDRSSFGVGDLAAELNTSERNLYRRIKSLTGVPVATLIREVRLNRGQDIIAKKQKKTIAEVAYAVGFKSPKHFSRAYKKRFGNLPSIK